MIIFKTAIQIIRFTKLFKNQISGKLSKSKIDRCKEFSVFKKLISTILHFIYL